MLGRWLLSLVALFCFIHCSPAQAARFSGEYLLYICSSDAYGKEKANGAHIACQSYIASVIDYHSIMQSMDVVPGVEFCVPENVSMGHLQNLVYNYFYQNRHEHSKFIAAPGVALALFESYPCGKW